MINEWKEKIVELSFLKLQNSAIKFDVQLLEALRPQNLSKFQ